MLDAADGINREAIDSSNLVSIGYSEDRQVCAVEFKSGAIFHYSGVSLDLFTAFYLAASRGSFFARNIKGKFSGRKMTGPCSECGINGIIGTKCTECGCGEHKAEEKRYGEPPAGVQGDEDGYPGTTSIEEDDPRYSADPGERKRAGG